MSYKRITLSCCAAAALLCGTGWLDNNFAKRTQVDIDEFRHPSGKEVMLTIDAARLGKVTGKSFSTDEVKLGFTDEEGKESAIAFATKGVDKVDNKMRLNFIMPQKKGAIHLYFDGKGSSSDKKYPNILNANALDPSKYKSDGKLKLSARPDGKMNIRQLELIKTDRKSANISAEQIFKVKPEHAGMPVTLFFDAFSNSKSMWPLAVTIQSLDANKKVVGELVCDGRWIMVQTAPEKPFYLRQAGKIDPRAKYLKVSLVIHRANEARPYDIHGKLLKDFSTSLPDLDISRFELVPGYEATIPGANSKLYTEGVKPGTSALKLAGYTSALYNNFPSNVWSGAQRVKNQDMVYFPIGNEGTAEFYLKFDEIPQKDVILFDNARNNTASFLRIEYHKNKIVLKMNGYDKVIKNKFKAKKTYELVKSAPLKLEKDKWIHFAATWSKSGVALYVDGKKVLSDSKSVTPAKHILNSRDRNTGIAEYTCIGADGHRYFDIYGGIANNNYFKGAADELRVSKIVRYTDNFTPAKEFALDRDTCALFSYEKNFDGTSSVGSTFISGSIFAGDVPPRADEFTVEDKNGNKKVVRYVPKDIPASNMPEHHICQTSYPVLPKTADYKFARVSKSVTKTLENGEKFEFTAPAHTVPEYVEIKAVDEPVKAPFLRHAGEIDARSFADVANSIDFSDCKGDHEKARKTFDFLVRSTDYYTFRGAEFVKYSNAPMHAASNGLVAINSYTCFQCGPLNGIASGLFTNGLGFPSVLTFGNGHLFQQVMVNGKLRVFDLSAQKYWPSRDQDDAASLDELEKDVYLFYRTLKGHPNAISHFFRMSSRGGHSVANAPRERLEYTLYPGESFRYYPASCGYTQDIAALTWNGKKHNLDTWKDMQDVTGASEPVGRTIQRLLPHTSQGIFQYDGKVTGPAFSKVTEKSFCYRIDSPYTIIYGTYSVADKNASFELSYDKGANWKKVNSENGVCRLEFDLRGRHAALLKVTTQSRDFKAVTVTQMSSRRQTGLARAGKNSILFTSDGGKASVTIAYRERAKEITLDGGFYSGTVPGLERQLFTLEPGRNRTIKVNGVSDKATVKASGGLTAKLADGKLTVTAPSDIQKGVKYVVITDGKAKKAADFLVCKGVKEYSIKDFKSNNPEIRKADESRPQDAAHGTYKIGLKGVAPGKYVIFTLTRRDNRNGSMMQAHIFLGKQKVTAARYRNPAFDFYKAKYGPFMARWNMPGVDEKTLDPWSRMRWDTSTGKDTYPRTMLPLEVTIKGNEKSMTLKATTDCFGVILLPSEDRDFMYLTIANLHHMSRADWIFDGYLNPIY